MSEIDDALDIAAEETTGPRSSFTSRERQVRIASNRLRRSVIRFLENVPEEMTVAELRYALDRAGGRI